MREYRAAGGVVIDQAGERVLVLIRPTRLDDKAQPEARLPKGHIEPGESRQDAAVREVCEEAGTCELEVVADLGQKRVEFDWAGYRVIRQESYFLMMVHSESELRKSEPQFERAWLPWDEARVRLTFDAEREWLCRARAVLAGNG